MDNIVNIKNVDPNTLEFQEYQDSDNSLISSFDVSDISFKPETDGLEYHIFDSNKNIIFSEYNFKKYSLIDNSIVIDQKENLTSYGFEEGQYYTLYNFITPLFSSSADNRFYISEISSDRTEIRLSSNTITGLKESLDLFISSSNTVQYYKDFFLNFGNDDLVISNNILLDGDSLLIKLYEPLSPQFDIKSELWVIEKLAESVAYFFELITVLTETENNIQLQGPNLNISIKDKISNSTGYLTSDSLNSSPSSSLTNQLNNILNNKSIRLNIDHSDYSNFVHFSSAETRLENYVYKLSLIESYNQSSISSSFIFTNFYLTSSQNIYLDKIKTIVEGFDSYEYCLYFSSGSTSWPKLNNTLPYINYPSTSSQGLSWLTGQLDSASLYDSENKDNLLNTIPSYLREDPRNEPYKLYVEMLGQHFDTLYLYTGELNNKYNSDNRVNHGMSKDLISDALKDFGIKIYQNNFTSNDLYTAFLGINPNLGLLPPTGSELISTYTTASSQVIPLEDVNNEIYKRIYHNLPLLLKKKGTTDGLRLLISTYGIPDTILRINEFGGKNRNESNDWDQFQNQFNYAFYTTSSGYVRYDTLISGSTITGSVSTVEFRFKTNGIPSSSISQSLAYFGGNFNIVLEYSGSGLISGSYSSSIVDPYNEYGTLKFINGLAGSASLYLPFFDGGWWSVMANIDNVSSFITSIYAKNKIYEGYDGKKIGFQASASLVLPISWIDGSSPTYVFTLSSPINKTIAGKNYIPFSGSFQELRFYKTTLSESVFNDYVMNPHSIEGNQLEGDNSLNSLVFRAPLGSVLESNLSSSRISIHPSINAYPVTYSFGTSGSSVYTLSGSYSFVSNRETYYYDQFPAGIKNIISNKIAIVNNIVPEGNTLSPFISIQQDYPISESHTRDVNYMEVGFSPQNEINDDIISQLGYFNIGNYIGDPRQLVNKNTTRYVDFDRIRDGYFKKYNKPFGLNDYIRIIKYFDNSLFKLVKDFTPARTSLATGVIIKQHLLERNRYSPAQVDFENQDYSGSVKSKPFNYSNSILYNVLGGNGGIMPTSSQSTSENFYGPKGVSIITRNDNSEFLNGELDGAIITASTQSLNSGNPFLESDIPFTSYNLKFYYDSSTDEYSFLNYINPISGQILFNPNYVKISKFDSNGNSNDNLRSLQYFTIKFSNGTRLDYLINSRTEYSDYFLYNIIFNTTGYTVDGLVLDYTMNSSTTGSVKHSVGPSAQEIQAIPLRTVSNDIRGYYTNEFFSWSDPNFMNRVTASFYTLQDYPNIKITFNISVDFSTSGVNYVPHLYLVKTTIPIAELREFNNNMPPEVQVVAERVGGPGAAPQTLTLSADLSNPLSGDSYFLVFKSDVPNTSLTSSIATLNITQSALPQSGSTDLVIFNPYVSQKFEGTDYDVLYGNADQIINSEYYQKIEYNNYNINTPYFQKILSGSATPSSVKDYYYTLRRHIYPRYIGSRNTSDNFNTISIVSASILQNNLKLILGPSIQQGVAYKYDTTIYEFIKGVNPPETPNFSKLTLGKIINTDVTGSATILNNDDELFYFTKSSQILPGDKFQFNQYGSEVINVPDSTSVYSTLISPNVASYAVLNTGSITAAVTMNNTRSGNLAFYTSKINIVNTVVLDNTTGIYNSGSIVTSSAMIYDISSSLAKGDEWYITFITGSFTLPFDSRKSFNPLSINEVASNITESLFTRNGILQITTASFDNTGAFGMSILYVKLPNIDNTFTNPINYGNAPSKNVGALIWKSMRNNNSILFSGTNFDQLKNGNFVTQNVSPFIKENLNYITQNFGSKPKN